MAIRHRRACEAARLPEQQRRELAQAAAPGEPFVRSPRGFIEDGVDAGLSQFFRVGPAGGGAGLGASVGEEQHLDLFPEGRRILDLDRKSVA